MDATLEDVKDFVGQTRKWVTTWKSWGKEEVTVKLVTFWYVEGKTIVKKEGVTTNFGYVWCKYNGGERVWFPAKDFMAMEIVA